MPLIYVSSRQKEAAALKIKATASNARENMSALRRLFFFCCRSVELGSVHPSRTARFSQGLSSQSETWMRRPC